MSEKNTPRFRAAVREELALWQADGLISANVADELIAQYPLLNQGNRSTTIALIIGSVLLGLGVMLFVGSNWEHMPRLLKVAIIFASIITSYTVGWRFEFEPGNRPKLGSALLLLGSLLYGAAIWLISQIFNFDTSLSNGLFLWTLDSAAVATVTKSRLVAVLSAILIPAWNLSQHTCCNPAHPYTDIGNIWIFLPSMAIGACLCAHVRSRVAFFTLLAGGATWVAFLSGTAWAGLLVYGIFLFVAYLGLRQKWDLFASPLLYAGAASALTACLVSTFDKTIAGDSVASFINLAGLLGATLVATMVAGLDKKENYSEQISALGIAIGGSLIALFAADLAKLLACNLLLVSMIGALIAAGMRLQKTALINLAIGFAVLDIICRYFDMFFSMIDRSLFFILGGLVLILAGAYAEKNRRKLMGSLN